MGAPRGRGANPGGGRATGEKLAEEPSTKDSGRMEGFQLARKKKSAEERCAIMRPVEASWCWGKERACRKLAVA
jgi:hypothetical protein